LPVQLEGRSLPQERLDRLGEAHDLGLLLGGMPVGVVRPRSYAIDAHVNRRTEENDMIEAVVEAKGSAAKVITSHQVAPVMREHNRTKSLVFQAYAAEKASEVLKGVEDAAHADGYDGRLLTLLSYGGAVDREYPRLYETVISGPIGGLTGAQVLD